MPEKFCLQDSLALWYDARAVKEYFTAFTMLRFQPGKGEFSMDLQSKAFQQVITSIFSDETALFRTPEEPDPGDKVVIRLRMKKGTGAQVSLVLGPTENRISMHLDHTDDTFDWFASERVPVANHTCYYSFFILWEDVLIRFNRSGAVPIASHSFLDAAHSFHIIPGFHTPQWARGSVQYQIFTDRFCNGNTGNDVLSGEYYYARGDVRHASCWDELPGMQDYRCFFGGDLKGVESKLDYLQSLGVETIYFNPVFVSPSSHKYDTQDYWHIDPHLGEIIVDGDYCVRTTDERNLKASDALFAHLCQAMHKRGMRIILDGVFNHCGSLNRWMDREGLYSDSGKLGAYRNPNSPYRSYFSFKSDGNYDAWWGVETLPKLNYENSDELCEEIFHIAEKWASPPYSIDGWRLDVAADLGHSRDFNHKFWKAFRRRVKAVNPNVLIIAEHYGDPYEWLCGDEWDTVMNYDAFMEPVTFFLTGLEKHSDFRREDLYQNGSAFFSLMAENMSHMPTTSLQCAMNELSNHDHSRFLTRTNGRVGRLNTAGSAAAGEGICKGIMREAVVIQMTWPGSPTIYYGDEAGQVGWTDPDNRRTYPWGHEDQNMIDLHKALTAMRKTLPVLKNGSLQPLCSGTGYVSYSRFDKNSFVFVACNNLDRPQKISIPLDMSGIRDGTGIDRIFMTDDQGFKNARVPAGMVRNGALTVLMEAHSACIYVPGSCS